MDREPIADSGTHVWRRADMQWTRPENWQRPLAPRLLVTDAIEFKNAHVLRVQSPGRMGTAEASLLLPMVATYCSPTLRYCRRSFNGDEAQLPAVVSSDATPAGWSRGGTQGPPARRPIGRARGSADRFERGCCPTGHCSPLEWRQSQRTVPRFCGGHRLPGHRRLCRSAPPASR